MATKSESPAVQFAVRGDMVGQLERLQAAAKKANKLVLYAEDTKDPIVSCFIIDEYIVA